MATPDSAQAPLEPLPAPLAVESSRTAALDLEEAHASAAVSSNPFLEFTVHWDDGTPVVAASVAVVRRKEVLRFGSTDWDGKLRVRAIEEDGAELFVLQGEAVLLHLPVPLRAGEASIEVPLRSAVRGTVRIAGAIPEGPVLVCLEFVPGRTGPPRLPPFLEFSLDWRLRRWNETCTFTDEDGDFTLAGLSADWSGSLAAADNLELSSGKTGRFLSEPASNVLLDLAPFPAFRGRVLSPAGTPVADCHVRVILSCQDQSGIDEVRTGPDGRFLAPFKCEGPGHASFEFFAEGVGQASFETAIDPIVGVNLGDIRLETGCRVRFQVEETEGSPIAGAVPFLPSRRGLPSGRDGRCALENLPPGATDVWIVAPDCEPKELTVDPRGASSATPNPGVASTDPIRVVLPRGARLEVILREPDGNRVMGARVLASGQPLFQTKSGGIDFLQLGLWEDPPVDWDFGSVEGGSGRTYAVFQTDASGRVDLRNLAPGARIHLYASDSEGADLGWRDSVLLGVGEERVLEATLTTAIVVLQGVVIGDEGAPQADATVALSSETQPSVRTDERGRFHFPPYAARPFDLSVRAAGYALRLVHVEDPSAPVRIPMDRGFECTVTFVDGQGEIRRPDKVCARQGEAFLGNGRRQADGSYGFRHVPKDPFEVSASLWGGEVSFPIHEEPQAVLPLPEPGHLRVEWSFELPEGDTAYVRVQHASDTDSGLHHPLSEEEVRSGWADVPELLPGDSTVYWLAIHSDGDADLLATAVVHLDAGETLEVAPPR